MEPCHQGPSKKFLSNILAQDGQILPRILPKISLRQDSGQDFGRHNLGILDKILDKILGKRWQVLGKISCSRTFCWGSHGDRHAWPLLQVELYLQLALDREQDKVKGVEPLALDQEQDKVKGVEQLALDQEQDKVKGVEPLALDQEQDKVKGVEPLALDQEQDKVKGVEQLALDQEQDKVKGVEPLALVLFLAVLARWPIYGLKPVVRSNGYTYPSYDVLLRTLPQDR